MHITFMPQRRDDSLSLSRDGDSLTINGELFDFSDLAEGALMSSDTLGCDWLVGEVTRTDGSIRLMLILPVGVDAPRDARFPRALEVADGPVPLLPGTA